MKKTAIRFIFYLLVFFSLLIGFLVYLNKVNKAIESSTKLMLLPEKIPAKKEGDRFFVYILLNSQLNEVAAVDIVIKFDKDLLEALDVVPLGSFPTYPDSSRVIDNQKGLVYLSAINYDLKNKTYVSPYKSIGLFGRISFQVKKSQTTNIDFVYEKDKTTTTNIIEATTGNNILYDKNQIFGVVVN